MDFAALYMTGYGVSASHLGQPDAWLLANIVPTGRSPELSARRLKEPGFAPAIWPGVLMQSTCAAMEAALAHLAAAGTTAGSPVVQLQMQQLQQLLGFEDIWAFERRWGQ